MRFSAEPFPFLLRKIDLLCEIVDIKTYNSIEILVEGRRRFKDYQKKKVSVRR